MPDSSHPLSSADPASPQQPEEPASPLHFRRSLSSPNFSPNSDLYDSLDEDWLLSSDVGELSIFDFLDGFNVIPLTLDRLNQKLKVQSREVPTGLI